MAEVDSVLGQDKIISGFSKLSKVEKIQWLVQNFLPNQSSTEILTKYWHHQESQQSFFDEFAENTLTNFYLPFSVGPNFLINNQIYCVPMVIEESSVVAAASKSAKFWLDKGGFHAEILGTQKEGTVYFKFTGDPATLMELFLQKKQGLIDRVSPLTENMVKRGGGIIDVKLMSIEEDDQDVGRGIYKLQVSFETCDAMGANFINSILEAFAEIISHEWSQVLGGHSVLGIMSILSNYTPECLVRAWVECSIEELESCSAEYDAKKFAEKFHLACEIARLDPYRATTHNKGIMNGVDAVVMATGNDFRAVEACAHSFAARSGKYQSLSKCTLKDGRFLFELTLPLALGTVGGLTSLHPLAKTSLEILGGPSSRELMKIVAVVGLAQNFGAVKSLVTTGIQLGHMKMHLLNILRSMQANVEEVQAAKEYFLHNKVSFSAVREFLVQKRRYQ